MLLDWPVQLLNMLKWCGIISCVGIWMCIIIHFLTVGLKQTKDKYNE